MKKFHLNVTSKDGELYNGKVDMVVAPGSEGQLGILAGHTPFISPLKEGRIQIKREGDTEKSFDVTGGFIEVSEERVNILIK